MPVLASQLGIPGSGGGGLGVLVRSGSGQLALAMENVTADFNSVSGGQSLLPRMCDLHRDDLMILYTLAGVVFCLCLHGHLLNGCCNGLLPSSAIVSTLLLDGHTDRSWKWGYNYWGWWGACLHVVQWDDQRDTDQLLLQSQHRH